MFFEMGAILQKKPVLQEENASRPNVFWIESTRNIFLQKIWWGRCWWKSSFYWWKMSRTWPKIQYFKNFDHKMAIFFSHITKFRKSHNIFFIWNIFVKNNNFWINLFGTIWWKIVRKMFVKINFETFQFSWKIYSGRYEKCLSK